jgi:hypothetical protein
MDYYKRDHWGEDFYVFYTSLDENEQGRCFMISQEIRRNNMDMVSGVMGKLGQVNPSEEIWADRLPFNPQQLGLAKEEVEWIQKQLI